MRSGGPGGFALPTLPDAEAERLAKSAREARGDILTMTTLAESGHPGGSMSSIEMYLTVWSFANVRPETVRDPGRDRIVVSHGHTSPGVYATLAHRGFVERDDAVALFRLAGSPFEGHVERCVPGVEWSTGNLGQGLSAACGMALAARLTRTPFHTFCLMSDGEQTKGQVAEARRFAKKYGLADLTVLVDYNDIQISGHVHDVMPEDIPAHWRAAGWKVIEVDGHDPRAIYAALHDAVHHAAAPVAIVARTVIGKGVTSMQDKAEFHGKALSEDQYVLAMEELGWAPDQAKARLETARSRRAAFGAEEAGTEACADAGREHAIPGTPLEVRTGEPRIYAPDASMDNRSAWGAALTDLAAANAPAGGGAETGGVPIAVFDCDLAGSVKTDAFAAAHPDAFFQSGVQEHTTATMAGALSTQGVLTFWADFGVFGIDETYNQHRLSDINGAELKLVLTHCGLDVGEDGKTHQCIDYAGVLRNVFGWKVVVPADPNQTDRAVRWMAVEPGSVALVVGRSKAPVITMPDGSPAFAGDWVFEYGRATLLREGDDCAIVAMGTMTAMAVRAHEILAKKGVGCRVLDMPSPLALDEDALAAAAATPLVVTYEDHHAATGLGASVALWLAGREGAPPPRFMRVGVTRYGSSGTPKDLYVRQKVEPESVAGRILGTLGA